MQIAISSIALLVEIGAEEGLFTGEATKVLNKKKIVFDKKIAAINHFSKQNHI